MNERDAMNNGYYFCGPTCSAYAREWELDFWKTDIAKAKKIKKEYRDADYVIATGSKNSWLGSGSRGLYGNEVFNKVWSILEHGNLERQPEIIKRRREDAEMQYKNALAEIDKAEQEYKNKLEFLAAQKR